MRRSTIGFLLLLLAFPGFSQGSFWLARTTGQLPFMEYGIGDDRLGGAKIGFLDSNVLVTIVDSFNTDYKVRLSTLHYAYIAKTSLVLQGKQVNRPIAHNPHLTGNIKVYGDTASDYVTLTLDDRYPYRGMQLLDPSRVVVDVFGVTSNTNWITQLHSAKEISNTWYEQVEDDVFRVYIQLKHPQHWGYAIAYDSVGRHLIIRIRRQPAVLDIRKLRIAIDAGHGGDNSGATGVTSKILEKNYTLLIAEQLRKMLKTAGVQHIFMTRTKDTTLSMPERIAMLKEYDPHLLVSIHLNSASYDTVEGTSTYYRYLGFRPLSMAILNRMLTLGLAEYGNVGSFNFSLSGPTNYPNVLVEVAFLSNPGDEKKILSPKFHKAVAQKIFLGIVDWLNAQKPKP
ncbi:N-acetylmuramoyl-L-alanine amidase family protein [Puia dinghuensis]|uniref:N-acetylmuramoyl-L-alanine amidase n=1 Tax=Puia dinghuensis TaxID=1792502 RepID=A0A8J2UFE6_9BACT|nr:N-acetylmuramoyl-L-alanine amidase [Puia dinghuensis]GGB10061.1 N-acetylmuramoyl-L-alanine amidase [Puia dinghuensis]